MANSSLLNEDDDSGAPRRGNANSDLGPSDNSDSGSDRMGLPGGDSDSDSSGTGDRASVDPSEDGEAADLIPDQAVEEQEAGQDASGDSADDSTEESRDPDKNA